MEESNWICNEAIKRNKNSKMKNWGMYQLVQSPLHADKLFHRDDLIKRRNYAEKKNLIIRISSRWKAILAMGCRVLTAEREDWNPLVSLWWESGPGQWWDSLWGALPGTCWSGGPHYCSIVAVSLSIYRLSFLPLLLSLLLLVNLWYTISFCSVPDTGPSRGLFFGPALIFRHYCFSSNGPGRSSLSRANDDFSMRRFFHGVSFEVTRLVRPLYGPK